MNTNSVSYDYVQNQQKSSWIDDPFDLKGTFKGMSKASHSSNLSGYLQELVHDYASCEDNEYVLLIDTIPHTEQKELIRLYLESTGRELNECVHGDDLSIDNEYTCAMLSMLKNDCHETREKFAEVTLKNILTYYRKSLQTLIDESCEMYFCNMMNDNDCHSHIDIDHGDVVWGRF